MDQPALNDPKQLRGRKAPDFSLPDQDGHIVSLKSYIGQRIALFFYPQDLTPTCTTEACNLRDHYTLLQKHGIVVLGISPDDEKKHQRFIATHQLPFRLLCDPELKALKKYQVWGPKNCMAVNTWVSCELPF